MRDAGGDDDVRPEILLVIRTGELGVCEQFGSAARQHAIERDARAVDRTIGKLRADHGR
jgi:hypothetical protein